LAVFARGLPFWQFPLLVGGVRRTRSFGWFTPLAREGNQTLIVWKNQSQLFWRILFVNILLCSAFSIIGSTYILNNRTIGIGDFPNFLFHNSGKRTDEIVNVHYQTLSKTKPNKPKTFAPRKPPSWGVDGFQRLTVFVDSDDSQIVFVKVRLDTRPIGYRSRFKRSVNSRLNETIKTQSKHFQLSFFLMPWLYIHYRQLQEKKIGKIFWGKFHHCQFGS
jgi:hypothetical protein